MILCVILEQSKVQKIIDSNWLKNRDLREHIINGIRPKQNEVQVIFYCNDNCQPPNFDLPLSLQFDEREPRCYRAYILNQFGKLKKIVFHSFEYN